MTLRYVYTDTDGNCRVVTAAPKEQLELVLGPLSDAAYEQHVLDRSIPRDGKNVAKLPEDWEAPDRSKRHAWRQAGPHIYIDDNIPEPTPSVT